MGIIFGFLRCGRVVVVVAAGLLPAACAPLPDISAATRTAPGPAPVLVPLDGILAQADAVGRAGAAVAPVDARANDLRARAERLRRR